MVEHDPRDDSRSRGGVVVRGPVTPGRPPGPPEAQTQVHTVEIEVDVLAVAGHRGHGTTDELVERPRSGLQRPPSTSSTPVTARPVRRSRRKSASASTSGASGTGRSDHDSDDAGGVVGAGYERVWAGSPACWGS